MRGNYRLNFLPDIRGICAHGWGRCVMKTCYRHLRLWLVLCAIVLVPANFPMQLRSVYSVGPAQKMQGEYEFTDDGLALPVAAGWPSDFYYRYDDLSNAEPYVYWSYARLLLNIGFATAVVVCLSGVSILYQKNRAKKSAEDAAEKEPDASKRTFWNRMQEKQAQLSIADMLVVTSLIALGFGTHQWLKRSTNADLAVTRRLGQDASYKRETILPGIIHDWLPVALMRPSVRALMARTTQVRLRNPTSQQVNTAMAMPHLRALSIGGGDYDLDILASLPNRHGLTTLHVTGRVLDDKTLSRVRLLNNLRDVSFARTNFSAGSLERLYESRRDASSRLTSLSLVDTSVDLSKLSESKVLPTMVSMKQLLLARPKPGTSAKLRISALPALQTLRILSFDRGKNSEIVKLEVADCPQLKNIDIDQLQKWSLSLNNLQKLETIKPAPFKTAFRLGKNQSIPGSMWIDEFVADDLPSLTELKVYASDIGKMRLTKTPNLKSIGPGVYQMVPVGHSGQHRYDSKVPIEATQALLEGIGKSDGPELIDYSSVPLAGADLSPLVANQRLRDLYLHDCGLSAADLLKLRGDHSLRTVTTHGSELDGKALGELLAGMPKLERWHGDLFHIDRLRIENHQHLKGVADTFPDGFDPPRAHFADCSALRLIDLPQWEDPIRLDSYHFQHLTIMNLPRLSHLIIDGNVCKGAVLSGLTGLSTIAAGGEHLTDEVIKDWADYRNLSSIRLYATTITADGFSKLLHGRQLSVLDLRGARVDDEAILGVDPSQLTTANLLDTDVTAESIRHVLKSPMLVELNVDEHVLHQESIDRIADQSAFRSLGIHAEGWTAVQFGRLAQMPELKHLTIRGLTLDKPVAQAFIAGGMQSLERLTLIDSTAEGPSLNAFLNHYPRVKLEAIGSDIPAVLAGRLIGQNRLSFESEATSNVYTRGPGGNRMPIFKQTNMGAGPFVFGSFGGGESYEPMKEEEFLQLTPQIFVKPKVAEPITFEEPNK